MFYVFVASPPHQPCKSYVECTMDKDTFEHPTPTWHPVAFAEFPDVMIGHACVLRSVIMQQKHMIARVQHLEHIAGTYGVPFHVCRAIDSQERQERQERQQG